MKRISTKAIILKRVNFEEADRILTAITLDQGKISLFAKGVRRAKSKLAGGLELFCVSDIVFIDGKSELKTIVSTRLDRHYTDITKDVNATMMAYEFLKLIDENTQESCDEQFFYLLEHSIESLSEHKDSMLTNVWFFVQLLKITGRSINLENQVNGTDFAEDKKYTFDFDSMGFSEHGRGQFEPKHIKFLRLLSKVDSPSNLLKVEGANNLARDVGRTLEQCAKHM